MNSSISARHSAELEHVFESLSLGSNDVENWRGNGWQRFPHHNPQWVWHQGVWDDNDKTSHHLMREKWISIIQVSIQVDLKEPGQKVDLGGEDVALQSPCALTLTYSCKITKQKLFTEVVNFFIHFHSLPPISILIDYLFVRSQICSWTGRWQHRAQGRQTCGWSRWYSWLHAKDSGESPWTPNQQDQKPQKSCQDQIWGLNLLVSDLSGVKAICIHIQ